MCADERGLSRETATGTTAMSMSGWRHRHVTGGWGAKSSGTAPESTEKRHNARMGQPKGEADEWRKRSGGGREGGRENDQRSMRLSPASTTFPFSLADHVSAIFQRAISPLANPLGAFQFKSHYISIFHRWSYGNMHWCFFWTFFSVPGCPTAEAIESPFLAPWRPQARSWRAAQQLAPPFWITPTPRIPPMPIDKFVSEPQFVFNSMGLMNSSTFSCFSFVFLSFFFQFSFHFKGGGVFLCQLSLGEIELIQLKCRWQWSGNKLPLPINRLQSTQIWTNSIQANSMANNRMRFRSMRDRMPTVDCL